MSALDSFQAQLAAMEKAWRLITLEWEERLEKSRQHRRLAVLAEREACAKEAEAIAQDAERLPHARKLADVGAITSGTALAIADVIRSRKP